MHFIAKLMGFGIACVGVAALVGCNRDQPAEQVSSTMAAVGQGESTFDYNFVGYLQDEFEDKDGNITNTESLRSTHHPGLALDRKPLRNGRH